MVFHTYICKFENFLTVVKSFLYAFKDSNCLNELKGDSSPVMLKEIFHDSFENFEITKICKENQTSVTGWQKLLVVGLSYCI